MVMRYGVVGWSHLRQEGFRQGEQWAASRRSISKTWQSLSLRGCSLWEAVGMVTKLMDSEVNWLLGSWLWHLWNMKFSITFVCLSFPICVKVGFRLIPTLWRYSEIICIDIGRMLRGKYFESTSIGLLGVRVRITQTGWIKQWNLLLHSSGEQKSERNVPARLVLSGDCERRICSWRLSLPYRWSVFSLNLLVYYLP